MKDTYYVANPTGTDYVRKMFLRETEDVDSTQGQHPPRSETSRLPLVWDAPPDRDELRPLDLH